MFVRKAGNTHDCAVLLKEERFNRHHHDPSRPVTDQLALSMGSPGHAQRQGPTGGQDCVRAAR